MNILQVTDYYKPLWSHGGAARAAYDISVTLAKKGDKVTVYTTNFREGMQETVKSNEFVDVDGTRVIYFENLKRLFRWGYVPPLPLSSLRVIGEDLKNYDVVHIHEFRTMLGIIVARYARSLGIPYVIQAHGSILPRFQKQGLKKIFDVAVGRKMLLGAAATIAVSELERTQYEAMGVPPGKIAVIPNGVYASDFDSVARSPSFRERYHLEDEDKVILSLGRINWIKGIDLLLSSLSEVKTKVPNVKLVIAGPDDGCLSDVQADVKRLGLEDEVVFTGPLYGAAKAEAYHSADVFALPSKYEIFGLTVLESMASGTPVVLTKNCGIYASIDGRCGLAANDEAASFATALVTMLSNAQLRERFSLAGKELVAKDYDWAEIVENFQALYSRVANTRYPTLVQPATAGRAARTR